MDSLLSTAEPLRMTLKSTASARLICSRQCVLLALSCQGHLVDFLPDVHRRFIGCNIEVVVHLKAKPEAGGIPKEACEPKGGVSGDATPAMHDLVDPARRDVQFVAQLVLAEAERLHELFQQNLARMDWRYLLHRSPSVVVYDLNGVRVAVAPHEADSPRIVDPNAMLSFPFAR